MGKSNYTGRFNIKAAIQIYRSTVEISRVEIAAIFGCAVNGSKVQRLKKDALKQMASEGLAPYGYGLVNTKCAFRAWKLDINELEKDYQRYMKLGLGDFPAPVPYSRSSILIPGSIEYLDCTSTATVEEVTA